MSMELLDNIRAVNTGHRKHISSQLFSISMIADSEPTFNAGNYSRQYSITVTLGANQWIAEEVIQRSGGVVVDQAVEHMKRGVADLIYGELRRDLIALSRTLRNEVAYRDSESLTELNAIIEKVSL
jgi:hypothetical protein